MVFKSCRKEVCVLVGYFKILVGSLSIQFLESTRMNKIVGHRIIKQTGWFESDILTLLLSFGMQPLYSI